MANVAAVADKMDMHGMAPGLGYRVGQHIVRRACAGAWRDQAQPLANPMHMRIDWKGWPTQGEEEDTRRCLGPYSWQCVQVPFGLFLAEIGQPGQGQRGVSKAGCDHMQHTLDARCLQMPQPTGANGFLDRIFRRITYCFPGGEAVDQSLKGALGVAIRCMLRKNRADQAAERITVGAPLWDAIRIDKALVNSGDRCRWADML